MIKSKLLTKDILSIYNLGKWETPLSKNLFKKWSAELKEGISQNSLYLPQYRKSTKAVISHDWLAFEMIHQIQAIRSQIKWTVTPFDAPHMFGGAEDIVKVTKKSLFYLHRVVHTQSWSLMIP